MGLYVQNIAQPVAETVFLVDFGRQFTVGFGDKFCQTVQTFTVPNEDVVGVVEIVFFDFGVGGNQFFAVAEGFKGAEREAVVNGRFEIYQDFCLFGGFEVVCETSDADEDFDVFRRIKTAEGVNVSIQTADIEVELPAQRFGHFTELGNNRGAVGHMPADEIEIVGRVFGQVDIVVEIEVGGWQEGCFGFRISTGSKT